MQTWKIYEHLNKTNGKRYIGITSKDNVKHRWNSGRGYKENSHFYSAIQKYGWDGFYHIVLLDGLTEKEAKSLEKYYIDCWKTQDNNYGYNMTSGGDGTPGFHPTDETKNKLSILRRKENLSEETLKRRSAGLKGRKLSNEHKMKIGLSNSKRVEMISVVDSDIYPVRVFRSAHEAEVETGVSHSHISQCCHGDRKSAGGYMWRFASIE